MQRQCSATRTSATIARQTRTPHSSAASQPAPTSYNTRSVRPAPHCPYPIPRPPCRLCVWAAAVGCCLAGFLLKLSGLRLRFVEIFHCFCVTGVTSPFINTTGSLCLQDCGVTSLRAVVSMMSDGDASPFEIIHSGLVAKLLAHLTDTTAAGDVITTTTSRDARIRNFMHVFLQLPVSQRRAS